MAESPLSLAAAPSSPAIVPPPQLSQATVPPPLLSQPNASSDPPAVSSPTPPASPPLSAPPPSVPALPPAVPASPPPTLPPLPSASPPPPDSTNAPPPVVSSPPPSPALPPPPTSSPSPPSQLLSPSPSSPPPPPPPPVTISPPPPDSAQSPPPPDSAQSPPPAPPPSSPSQPPPSAQTPPLPFPSPPSSTPAPPSDPSAPPPKNAAPTAPSPSSPDQSAPPPKNAAPTTPSPPSPPPSNVDIPPPQVIQSPAPPSVDPNKPPDSSQNATAGPPDSTFHRGSGIKTGAVVPIVLVAGLFMLSLLGFAVWYTRKRRRSVGRYNAGFVMPSPYASSQYSETSYSRSPTAPLVYNNSSGAVSHGFMNSPGMGNSKSCFTYAELHKITDGFSSKNLLGEGGFGCVYKGCFADGREVAVKQLKVGGGQGEREFAAEVEIISRVHHRHLVSLVGYCIADKQRLLVYDFVCNDTLDYHLHAQGGTVLSWAMRVKIAAGAARGIAYLHEDCHPRIIHRDIKSSNILLDSNFEAQVSDFGLARLAMDAETHITTRVMGTFGYLAPEYASSGKLTDRSDVYSFGVVLLELITGRKPVDQTQPIGEESLVEWARPLMTQALDSGDFGELPDARLENNYNENEMFRMIEAAAACVRHSAAMRPKMGLVVRALDTLTDTDINNGVIPGQSELFAAPQSAEIRMFQRMAFGSQNFSDGFTRSSWLSRTESETTSDVP